MHRYERFTHVAEETIDRTKAAGEFMFMGLRMIDGVSSESFRSRFAQTPVQFYRRIVDWMEGKLMEERNGRLRLTRKGLMLANAIFVEFM